MILIELINWMIEHWGEVTLNAVLLLLLRKFIMAEVHKLLYFNRDEEMEWIRQKIEKLTGEKWSGQQPIYKRVLTLYTKRFIFYSRKAILLEKIRRKKKMKSKLLSRKFIMAIIAVIIPVINSEFGINLDTPTIIGVLSAILGYIAVQGHVDAKTAQNGGTSNVDAKPTGDSGAAV